MCTPGDQVQWMLPGQGGSAAEAVTRIALLCQGQPDLFGAMLAVVATHPQVAVEPLAQAVSRFRPDLAELSAQDVQGLLISVSNGGRHGFDAVWRTRAETRKREQRKLSAALPWARD